MDCPLSTWPSITQYDDFTWAGLGDIDPLELLDRSFDNDSEMPLPNSLENKHVLPPAIPAPDCEPSSQISHPQGGDLYRLRSSESLAAARWESINAVDLDSVLDSTFPSQDSSTTPSEGNVYDLYSDGILDGVDVFMSENTSDGAKSGQAFIPCESIQVNASDMTPAIASLSSSQEDMKCENGVVESDSPTSINILQTSISDPVSIVGDCKPRIDEINNAGGLGIQAVQPYAYNPLHRDPCPSSQSPLDLKDSMFASQPHGIQTNRVMQWSNTTSSSAHSQVFDGEEVHQSSLHAREKYPAIIEQQVRLADAARVELKRSRAQASRARRLAASQRRAKKYPLQKLIRMSSPPTGARDRLEQNLGGASIIPHPPPQMVSHGQFVGGGQPLPRSVLNLQVPGFLPAVLQSPHLSSNHEVLPHVNPLQAGPYFCCQQSPVASLEDKHVQSGSGVVQSMTDQDVQSMTSTPSMALSGSTNSTQYLDAAVLEQLQTVLGKMNVDMRLCIRDALYRLANSSKHRQSRMDSTSDSSSSHSKEAMETNTNPIDRWIVNILFCKQPTSFQIDPVSQHAHTLTQAGDPSFENAQTDGSSQQWNSCGSSVNLQEQLLHVLTGL